MEERIEKHAPESALPEFPNCFICGKRNTRGLRIPFYIHEKSVRATFVPDETLVGYEDAIHGGIISALLDEAIVWASYAFTKRFGVTAELIVRFLKPLHVNEECTIVGKMIEDKGRIWIVEGKMMNAKGDLVERAKGKVIPRLKDDAGVNSYES